ncbi:hypothetical protein HYH02_002799 [Chlamydomonas schloesseri]|uniref:Uncharacterized protein n=1 Tax=Chlamydomonas schloesseri TaxID=2026947 RepID=A0A835WRI2_9CHLO|nr:hypothetical protein HYH02_002799 [Chlamydomonas schloesseri]|eukprot:KAG2452562.1 hypothetical protein HYH02_002799 [Chlamydomonas schloesseri]
MEPQPAAADGPLPPPPPPAARQQVQEPPAQQVQQAPPKIAPAAMATVGVEGGLDANGVNGRREREQPDAGGGRAAAPTPTDAEAAGQQMTPLGSPPNTPAAMPSPTRRVHSNPNMDAVDPSDDMLD